MSDDQHMFKSGPSSSCIRLEFPQNDPIKQRKSFYKRFLLRLRDSIFWNQLTNSNFYIVLFADTILFILANIIAYLIRFEFQLSPFLIRQFLAILPYLISIKLFLFYCLGVYRGMYRYTSLVDLRKLAYATFLSTIILITFLLFLNRFESFSRAVFILDGVLTFILAGCYRLAIRLYYMNKGNGNVANHFFLSLKKIDKGNWKRVLIIGAGDAGEQILRQLSLNSIHQYHVVGFLDDDRTKKGRMVHGLPVLGNLDELPRAIRKHLINLVLIALPSREGDLIRRIITYCKEYQVECKTLPSFGEIIGGVVTVNDFRDIHYQDLLGRPQVNLNMKEIAGYLTDKIVLVTGCGGSIGSELCRHIIRFMPRKLILIDASEENLFNIQMELHHEFKYKSYQTILARVQNKQLMESVFKQYQPNVVLHAAAYKHVPMMELNPWEAFFNNIMASSTVMDASHKFGVERFVLVSTDKAVRPANVMGASKRVAELLLKSYHNSKTKFMAVRFGNVLGSSGSVVPLFQKQIRNGGPVTVTHPEVTRYFMTITEAVQLILQAGAMGRGDEIFVLKMGTPVKIADMAKDLIRLSGKEPGKDIEIVYSGLREGEKLYEELITEGEDIEKTLHESIMVLKSTGYINNFKNPDEQKKWLDQRLFELKVLGLKMDTFGIKNKLCEIVVEYTPQETACIIEAI